MSSSPVRLARFLSASARPFAGAELQRGEADFLRQCRVRGRELGADAQQRLVEAETGFDADHEQVDGVGQRQLDGMLPAPRHPGERHPGHDVSEQAAPQAQS